MTDPNDSPVARRLREAAGHLQVAEFPQTDTTLLVVGDSADYPDAEVIQFKCLTSHAWGWLDGIAFRSIEHYKADGTRDTTRSRYFINGRRVKHARYQRVRRGP